MLLLTTEKDLRGRIHQPYHSLTRSLYQEVTFSHSPLVYFTNQKTLVLFTFLSFHFPTHSHIRCTPCLKACWPSSCLCCLSGSHFLSLCSQRAYFGNIGISCTLENVMSLSYSRVTPLQWSISTVAIVSFCLASPSSFSFSFPSRLISCWWSSCSVDSGTFMPIYDGVRACSGKSIVCTTCPRDPVRVSPLPIYCHLIHNPYPSAFARVYIVRIDSLQSLPNLSTVFTLCL